MQEEAMSNDVSEQLADSREELESIRAELQSKPGPQPICHHFGVNVHLREVELEARLSALVPALSRHGFKVDPPGGGLVQAWELVRPSEEWSENTVRKLCAIADEAGFIYNGWTWEPSGRPSYLSRVKSGALIIAPLLMLWLVIELGWSWFSRASLGSPVDVGLRILGIAAFIGIASFLASAYYEWEDGRKYR